MDGLGAEVSAKIRSAIKAKLIELEAYVDDELPDYIMVMVANNRTKVQMEDDLGLFLNNNTGAFTNWLHAVLEKLKKVTLEEVTKKEVKKKKPKKVSEKPAKKAPKERSEKSSKEKHIKEPRSSRGEERSRKRRSSGRMSRSPPPRSRERKSSSSKSARPPPGVPTGGANANMEALGRPRKKKSSSGLDESGGADGYNPASLLKSALSKTSKQDKESPKKSSGSSTKKEKVQRDDPPREKSRSRERPKNIINLKEETDFYARKERDGGQARTRSPRRGRSRSRSPPAKVASLVSKVVRPPLYVERRRSYDMDDLAYDPEREGRRALASRAQMPQMPPRPIREWDREKVGAGSARAVGRAMLEADRSIRSSRREEGEWEERGRRALPREDSMYEDLKRRQEEMELRVREERREQEHEQGRRGRLAMDQEPRRREARREELPPPVEEDMRIIVRRELTPEPSPPKKLRLEDEDAELLEMRRKALESLMKRTDKEIEMSPRKRVEESSESSSSESEDSTDDSELSEAEMTERPEPTFVVTLDGLDNKFFKSKQKGALELAREKLVQEKQEVKSKKAIQSPRVKKTDKKLEKLKKMPGSKLSSDGELELHPSEQFDDSPIPKKVVNTVGSQESRPTMKVAAMKRSPILGHGRAAEGSKKVAEVKPVVSTAKPVAAAAKPVAAAAKPVTAAAKPATAAVKPVTAAAKPSTVPAAKLAGSYAEKLAAIRAAKAKKAAEEAKKAASANTSKAPFKTITVTAPTTEIKAVTAITSSTTAPSQRPTNTKQAIAPKIVHKITNKPEAVQDSPVVAKLKKFTPITAPSPDPPATVGRFKSAPPALAFDPTKSTETCRFWPACKRQDACAFYHPPPPVAKKPFYKAAPIIKSAEAVLAVSAGASKFKWSAK